MEKLRNLEPVAVICGEIMGKMDCDFVGLAIQNQIGPDVRWHYAVGNLNEKYQRITVRFGKGIAGKVIMTGSPMMIEDFPNGIQGKPTEHPIMLAEKLVSSYAVPLFIEGVPKGVLFVGARAKKVFSGSEQQHVQQSALSLEKALAGQMQGGSHG